MGRTVLLGDIEDNATQTAAAGQYGTAVLLESLTHIKDKPGLLRWLRSQTTRLVLRVNTRPDDEVQAVQAPSVVFGDSMALPTAAQLKQALETAGWRIKHWRNERTAATPTLDAYKTRLDALPVGPNNTQIELLRSLVELNDQRKCNNGSWAVTHGLLTVVAVSGDPPERTTAAHRRSGGAAVAPSACEASLDEAVAKLEDLLSVATEADLLPVPTADSEELRFTDLFRCVAAALRPHADNIRVPTSDGTASADVCPDAAFWRRQLLRLSSKTRIDAATGRVVASINRYSVGIPRTLNSSVQRQVAWSCLVTAMAAPRSVLLGMLNATKHAAKQPGDAGEGVPIELGVAWPNVGHLDNETRSGRLYLGQADHDDLAAFEWAIDGTEGKDAASRDYRKAPTGKEHASCVHSALATAIPAKRSLADPISTAKGCWVSNRGVKGVKRDLRLASPIPVASLLQELQIELPVAQSELPAEQGLAVTVIAVQRDAFTLYFQHIDVQTTPSPSASSIERTPSLIPMPPYPLPASQGKLSLIPAADRVVFFRDIFGRRSHHFKFASGQGSVGARAPLGGLDFRSMLGAAHERSQVRWKTDGADVTQERQAELEDDLDATWSLMANASPGPTKGRLSAVLAAVETYAADWELSRLHEDLLASFGLAVGINAYFSAPKATALRPHTDPYDVIVVQLQGTKRWHVCPAVLDDVLAAAGMTESDGAEVLELKRHSPLGCTLIDDALNDPNLACREVVLGPGDVLYLPKGVVHTAVTVSDTLSAHLTISLKRHGVRWADLFSAVCGKGPHSGCASLETVAATALAGVAWLRPFPIWLGAGVAKTPEVLRHFEQLRRQLENFEDANQNRKAVLEGHVFDGAALPRVTVSKLLEAVENGWESSLGGRKPGDATDDQPPPFMRMDSATGRVRRGACNAGALFQCPDGQLQQYQYLSPTNCDSCDTPSTGNSCSCDGYCENNAAS